MVVQGRSPTGMHRASPEARTGRKADDRAIYARAIPKRAEISETYNVTQVISRNWSVKWSSGPGRIEIEIPYDGDAYFTRQAVDDVTRAIPVPSPETGQRDATVGHLLLGGLQNSNLPTHLKLYDKPGAVALQIPVTDVNGNCDLLTSDCQTCVIAYDYQLSPPEDFQPRPLDAYAPLEIELYDPDILDLPAVDLLMNPEAAFDVTEKMRQDVAFKRELELRICLRLRLPVKAGQPPPPAKVAKVSVSWPTITSPRTLSLSVSDNPRSPRRRPELRQVRYNPVGECLEWADVWLFPQQEKRDDDQLSTLYYQSGDMLLSIGHPGELYEKEQLNVRVDVEISGYLLSGLEARLYDATGHQHQQQPKLTTRIQAEAEFALYDAFATRRFSPFHHLVFDGIVPSKERITDIMMALRVAGFDPHQVWPSGNESETTKWLLLARRRDGPDLMELWIYVDGIESTVQRATQVPDGGIIEQHTARTGQLRVFVRGVVPRKHKELTREMNALQRTLRERFARL